jgi:hypothetical protein
MLQWLHAPSNLIYTIPSSNLTNSKFPPSLIKKGRILSIISKIFFSVSIKSP